MAEGTIHHTISALSFQPTWSAARARPREPADL